MTAKIIDGKEIAAKVREQVRQGVQELQEKYDYTPGLATVLVGEDPASSTYVRMKQRMCEDLGIRSIGHTLPADSSQEEVEGLVRDLNADPNVNGILVQLPLPGHIDEESVLNTIDLEKDVDGFHPVNIGRLAMKGREPLFIPCTPHGVMVLLEETRTETSGAEAVIVGRSNIVGLPVALLLQKANATITICHSRTQDLAEHTRQADILIAASGRAEMITGDMIKPGARKPGCSESVPAPLTTVALLLRAAVPSRLIDRRSPRKPLESSAQIPGQRQSAPIPHAIAADG